MREEVAASKKRRKRGRAGNKCREGKRSKKQMTKKLTAWPRHQAPNVVAEDKEAPRSKTRPN